MTGTDTTGLTQLGTDTALTASPDSAVLERLPAPHRDQSYMVRFACPEFTSLCPITGSRTSPNW